MQNNEVMRQINAFAMQDGVVLGLWGAGSLTAFRWSFAMPFFSTLYMVMLLGTPLFAYWLTLRFRRTTVEGGAFPFLRGFLHSLLMGFYASIWIALVIFVYLSYFDMGRIFLDYGQMLCAPEMQQSLREAGMQPMIDALSAGHGAEGVAHTLQQIGVANYAVLPIYLCILFGPLLAVLIGWGARRSPRNYRA